MLGPILRGAIVMLFAAIFSVEGQTAVDTKSILERLDQLESENRRLSDEIKELRQELARAQTSQERTIPPDSDPPSGSSESGKEASAAQEREESVDSSLTERLAVQETRAAELDQKKVESSEKMPVQLTGMLLFNAFRNGEYSGSALNDPVVASSVDGQHLTGATFRQTVLGLRFFGPPLPGGGAVSGSVYMDFFGSSTQPGSNLFRLRLATIDLAWKNTTLTVGQDKPIIAPREPVSLAEVGVSPLTGAGNLWQWQPQARVEQRFALGETNEIRIQAGVFETYEQANTIPAQYASSLSLWRPAYEARVQYGYSHGLKRFEIAPGYHAGASRVAGQSVESRAFSLDWLVRPWSRVDFTGAWFSGRNLAGLGTLRQGFTILSNDSVIPVHSNGGWSQITITAAPRLSFHLFGGMESDRAADLVGNGITRNLAYGANAMWKLAPNVIAALEYEQLRTTYLSSGTRLNNHYDLALGYLF